MEKSDRLNITGLLRSFAKQQDTRRVRKPRTPEQPYHAVTVRALASGCDAAKALADKIYLACEAPKLPLEECDAAVCKCKFKHHPDRRQEIRRAEDEGAPAQESGDLHRRTNPGRRETDRTDRTDMSGTDYFQYTAGRTHVGLETGEDEAEPDESKS